MKVLAASKIRSASAKLMNSRQIWDAFIGSLIKLNGISEILMHCNKLENWIRK